MLNAGIGPNSAYKDLVAASSFCRQWIRMVRRIIDNGYPLHRSKGGTSLVGAKRPG